MIGRHCGIIGPYHGSYRKNGKNEKEHANLKGFSGADPPTLNGAKNWNEAISQCEKKLEELQEQKASLKRMLKALEKAKKAGNTYPVLEYPEPA